MVKLSYGQLFCLLIAISAFNFISSPTGYSPEQMTGALLSLLAQLLVSVIITILYEKNHTIEKNKIFGRYGILLYALFFIVWGAVMLIKLRNVTESIHFPIGSRFFSAVLLVITAIYSASLGLKAIARGSIPIFILLLLSLTVVFIGAFPKLDLNNITYPNDFNQVIKYFLDDFYNCGELVVLFILLNFTKKEGRLKGTGLFLGGKIIMIELLSFMGICVLERLCYTSKYPFFLLGSYSQPFSIQRADWVYIILFTVLCMTSFAVQLMLSAKLLSIAFPKLRRRELLSAAIMLILSVLMMKYDINTGIVTGIGVISLAIVIPLLLAIFTKASKATDSEGSEASNE